MWKAFQNWQEGFNSRMSGESGPLSGFMGMPEFSFPRRGNAGQSLAMKPRTIMDSLKVFTGMFKNDMSPMSQKYVRQGTSSHGPGAPRPYGDMSSNFASPYYGDY